MVVRQRIKNLLEASGAVTAIVADRIYPGQAPQGANYPRIEWGIVNSEPGHAHSGRDGSDVYLFDVHCSATSAALAAQLAEAVEAALDLKSVSGSDGVILKQDEFDQSELAGSAGDERITTIVLQFSARTQ